MTATPTCDRSRSLPNRGGEHYYRSLRAAYRDNPGHWGQLLVSPSVSQRMSLAADPGCPQSFMLLLADDEAAVRESLAGNPVLPVRVMMRIARGGGSAALRLVGRPDVPLKVLGVAVATAERRAPGSRWGNLRDPNLDLLDTALRDRRLPDDWFSRYARGSGHVRRAIAKNRHCPEGVLLDLARRGNQAELAAIAANPAATAPVLDVVLRRALWDTTQRRALVRLVVLDWRLARPRLLAAGPGLRREVAAGNRRAAVLMAADPDWRIRRPVALCSDNAALLRTLATDPHGHVRRAASRRLMDAAGV